MRFVTSVSKADLKMPGHYPDLRPMTPLLRQHAVDIAVKRATASFAMSDLCAIRVEAFEEWGPTDLSAARITLDIGGAGYGSVEELRGATRFVCSACDFVADDAYTIEVINDLTGACPECGAQADETNFKGEAR